ncbi:MAG: UDP-N-acetylmuramate--L-alanine ligase [Ilumatobacteraceae bacterium]
MSRIHIVGVGGPGMSAIAIVLVQMGHEVSGSDIRESPVLGTLRALGVRVNIGHDKNVVFGCDTVTASAAIPNNNIELEAARQHDITVLTRGQMLADICGKKESIGVAGTHGKTTTSSMLMLILADADMHPSFIIGGDVVDVGTGAQWTAGSRLVVEADESDGTHRQLPLSATILTNIDIDHLDHFGNLDGIFAGFDSYLSQIPGPKVLCLDDVRCAQLARKHEVMTYGIDSEAQIKATSITFEHGTSAFDVDRQKDDGSGYRTLGHVVLPLRGQHNVLNALGALTMAMALGVSFDSAARTLGRFGGVARRFDHRGIDTGVTFVDDYAHLPAEIRSVLTGARDVSDVWNRIVAVFQPNRYNRMSVLSPAYADAFVPADVVVITEIYPSGTTPIPGVTGKLVVNAVLDSHPCAHVVWLPERIQLVNYLATELRTGDLCISMGCGDIESLPDEVISRRTQMRDADTSNTLAS